MPASALSDTTKLLLHKSTCSSGAPSQVVRLATIRNYHRSILHVYYRRSVEHCTPHVDGAPYISLAYLIYLRMIKFSYILAECGRVAFRFNLQ